MNTPTYLKLAALAVATSALMACGGISSDAGTPTANPVTPNPTPSPTPTPPDASNALPHGIWQSAAGAAITTSALVTQDGQVWSVLTTTGTTTGTTPSTTRLLKANLAASGGVGFSGTGKVYLLGTPTATPEAVTLNATALSKTSLSGTIASAASATAPAATPQTEPFSLAYQSRYDTPTTLASFAGNAWTAILGAGTLNWRIEADGKITGTRTTGCTYTGQISLRTEAKAVANVAITESCPAVTQMSGVALKTADNTGITLLLTTSGDAQGVVIGLK